MNDPEYTHNIRKAWALEENPEKIQEYYKDWSQTYDQDVENETYLAPGTAVALLMQSLNHDELDPMQVLDAGCGTGLVGELLKEVGFSSIKGFDLSADMVAKAQDKNVYDQLWDGIDLNRSLADQIGADEFDVVTCVGVLTLGHVPPSGFDRLLDVTKLNGLVVINARDAYVEEHEFEAHCDQLESSGRVRFLQRKYLQSTGDSLALFLVAERLS
ncbi:MAG: class I SAM-dependent methyltransferase [Pseudomonadota bacterium]